MAIIKNFPLTVIPNDKSEADAFLGIRIFHNSHLSGSLSLSKVSTCVVNQNRSNNP